MFERRRDSIVRPGQIQSFSVESWCRTMSRRLAEVTQRKSRAVEVDSLRRSIFLIGAGFCCGAVGWTILDRYGLQGLRPAIACDRSAIDVECAVERGCECEFRIRNSGGGELVVSEVKLSCGSCIKLLTIPKRPIAAGESQLIRLQLLPGKATAGDVKRLTVFSNDLRCPRLTLFVKIHS